MNSAHAPCCTTGNPLWHTFNPAAGSGQPSRQRGCGRSGDCEGILWPTAEGMGTLECFGTLGLSTAMKLHESHCMLPLKSYLRNFSSHRESKDRKSVLGIQQRKYEKVAMQKGWSGRFSGLRPFRWTEPLEWMVAGWLHVEVPFWTESTQSKWCIKAVKWCIPRPP